MNVSRTEDVDPTKMYWEFTGPLIEAGLDSSREYIPREVLKVMWDRVAIAEGDNI